MWQDTVLTAAAFVFLASLVPSILDARTRIPRRTSVPTAAAIWTQVAIFITLGLALTAIMTAAIGLAWSWLAWKRAVPAAGAPSHGR